MPFKGVADYLDLRLALVSELLAHDHGVKPLHRKGYLGAAVVVLHAAIDEWVTGQLYITTYEVAGEAGASGSHMTYFNEAREGSLVHRIRRLASLEAGEGWSLSPGPQVQALRTLSRHRNRMVHMSDHLTAEGTDDYSLAPTVILRPTLTFTDGSEQQGEPIAWHVRDPWRAVPPGDINAGLTAFEAMREQWSTLRGSEVGTREFRPGRIWVRR